MSTSHVAATQDADELPQEILNLGEKVVAMSPGPEQRELWQAYQEAIDCIRRRRRILNIVQEALSQLRLDIKYLMFDLDATRKERDELKKTLEDRWTSE